MREQANQAASGTATDFSLVLGGPLYQFLVRARLSGSALELLHRRMLVLVAVAWVPLLILSLIEAEPRHGYELSKLIESQSGGVVRVHAASLYPLLYRLEKQKWIEGRWVERNGQRIRVGAPLVIVACGAINSAALLLRSASDKHRSGLANSSGLVGRRYMAHLATMMQGFHPFRRNDTVFQKTVAINDYYLRGPDTDYPLGQIQSQGRTHAVMAQTAYPFIPLWAYEAWVSRGVDWLIMSEDLPRLDNRVMVEADGRIRLHYRPNNLKAHRRLVKETKRILYELGFWRVVKHSHGSRNTTHQCGTLVFGNDPRNSVLDPYCRTHDVENLFVVDASFFPSSAAVNPGLTIAAQALRVADHIKRTELRLDGDFSLALETTR